MRHHGILLEDISIAFNGTRLFDRFSVEVVAGQCTCLLGPSGCGKSTLLALISGHGDLKYSGRVAFTPEDDAAPGISWMAQRDLLLPWLSVLDNVLLGAKLRCLVNKEVREKAEGLLRQAGLSGKGQMFPWQLSGGMRQRVALLRTLIEENPVVLMDEPFSALDTLTRMKLQNLAAQLTRGRTVLMVTHDPLEALRLADRILVIHSCPVRRVSILDLQGVTPRQPDDPELQRLYSELLQQLLSGDDQ